MSSLLKLTNNALGRLSANASAGATTLSLVPGDGAKFPTLTGSQFFPATLIRASDGAIEIVKVTARSSDTLTVTRAQETTTALAFVAGDRIELRMTAKTFTDEFARMDADIATANETANAALPKTGGPISGDIAVAGDISLGAGKKLIFEGTTDDAFETILSPGDPTADRTLTMPNKSGTLATEEDTMPKTGGQLSGLLKYKEGDPIASASTIDLSAATGNTVHITGTTGISAITMTDGQVMDVIFDGALTLTHHATNNNLPSLANITTEAGDRARFFYDGTTTYCLQYQRASGRALVENFVFASAAENAAGVIENKAIDPLGFREALPTALADLAVGAVGSYAFLGETTTTQTAPGGTRAGSSLRYTGYYASGSHNSASIALSSAVGAVTSQHTPNGTWVATGVSCGAGYYGATTWKRIS